MMVLLPGNVGAFKKEVRQSPDKWGWLITPRRSMAQSLGNIPGARWAADNECYTLGKDFDPDRYVRFLERTAEKWSHNCLFATAPDVVGDSVATLDLFNLWEGIIHQIGLPVALVAQDGLESMSDNIPWNEFECLFIGGTTEWKMGQGVRDLIIEAQTRRKWIHMGRVNSQTRLAYCIKLGVDSVDGTEWAINPGRGIHWASQVMGWLELQKELPLCYT